VLSEPSPFTYIFRQEAQPLLR